MIKEQMFHSTLVSLLLTFDINFLSAILQPKGQLWTTEKEVTSLTQC